MLQIKLNISGFIMITCKWSWCWWSVLNKSPQERKIIVSNFPNSYIITMGLLLVVVSSPLSLMQCQFNVTLIESLEKAELRDFISFESANRNKSVFANLEEWGRETRFVSGGCVDGWRAGYVSLDGSEDKKGVGYDSATGKERKKVRVSVQFTNNGSPNLYSILSVVQEHELNRWT